MAYRQWFFLTETNGIQASPFKGNHQKIFPDFKLGPFKAESIQNPKSKIEMTHMSHFEKAFQMRFEV
jgi:hypothetical protein